MDPFSIEAIVDENGGLVLPIVPFPPGAKLLVILQEAEPMDCDAFEAALQAHYDQRGSLD